MKTWMHVVLWLVVGVALGYYVPSLGASTFGRLYPAK